MKASLFWLLIFSLAVLTACTNSEGNTNGNTDADSTAGDSEGTVEEEGKVYIRILACNVRFRAGITRCHRQ